MSSFESRCLWDCHKDFKPVFYKLYTDEIFALFSSLDHTDEFKEDFLSKHSDINFSVKKKKDGCSPFFDIKLTFSWKREIWNVYRKKTFSEVYTNFKSIIHGKYNISLIKSLLFRCFSLWSDFAKFHHEVDKLRSM